MLQAYGWELYVKINNNDWEDTRCSGWSLIEGTPPREEAILTDASFEEVCNYMSNVSIPCFHIDFTLFKKRKFLRYHRRYVLQEDEKFFEKDIKSISIQLTNTRREVSLKEIFEHCPAEQAIQYMKERGLTTCPYGVEK